MKNLEAILCLASCLLFVTGTSTEHVIHQQGNSSDSKDMYVIHAMVYQVGIVTNKTDNDTSNMNTTGNQEVLTFYHNNGSQIDLSQLPAPLMTNVTAQSVLGVAPVSSSHNNSSNQLSWNKLNDLKDAISPLNLAQESTKQVHDANADYEGSTMRSIDDICKSLFKREAINEDVASGLQTGAAVIPPSAGVQSIAIPPLMTLNNNLSQIPVPIPNTSVVHYAKINTLLTTP